MVVEEKNSSAKVQVVCVPWVRGKSISQRRTQANTGIVRRLLSLCQPVLQPYLIQQYGVTQGQAAAWLELFLARKNLELELVTQKEGNGDRLRAVIGGLLEQFILEQKRLVRTVERRRVGPRRYPKTSGPLRVAGSVNRAQGELVLIWARAVLAEALHRMQQGCLEAARNDIWQLFRAAVLDPLLDQLQPLRYEELVTRFGFRYPSQVYSVLHSARRTYIQCLHSVVAEYLQTDADVEAEIHALRAALASPQTPRLTVRIFQGNQRLRPCRAH